MMTMMMRRTGRRLTNRPVFSRLMCSGGYQFDNNAFASLDAARWPETRGNTMLNLCRQGEKIVVERLGKFHKVVSPGFFTAVPLMDRLAYVVDTRERSVDVNATTVYSADNAAVTASGQAVVRFVDAEKAAYGSSNPYVAVKQAVQTALRSAISQATYDDALRSRQKLNSVVENEVRHLTEPWGVTIQSFVLTDIVADKQTMAERTAASASPATRPALGNAKSQLVDTAEARAMRTKASADAIRLQAEASADAIKIIAKVLETTGDHGRAAAHFVLVQQQIASGQQPLQDLITRAVAPPKPTSQPPPPPLNPPDTDNILPTTPADSKSQ